MDIMQFMAMTHQTVQEFAQKMAHYTLTEYEMLAYESCCRAITEFGKIQALNFKNEFEKWLKDHPEDGGDDESGNTGRTSA